MATLAAPFSKNDKLSLSKADIHSIEHEQDKVADPTEDDIKQLRLQIVLEDEKNKQRKLEEDFASAVNCLPLPFELLRRGLCDLGHV
jgi:hypothetical protein